MQTKNTTPFLFGTKVTSLQPPQPQMTAIVKATFRLRPGDPLIAVEDLMEQGPLRADTFGDGDDDRVGECVYASDFADFKLRGEVLVKGTCHTPGGRPLAECPVRVSVGAWSKTLVVVGRRVWTEKLIGNAVSEPQPFAAMPLGYANAFGGPGYAANPSGKGLGTPELPNVEQAAARARSKGDRPEPAGFGPINPVWPQRAGKLGKDYGRAWKKERAPFYASDFDWTHFNAAPQDQQLKDYLRGDEEIAFVNMHPKAPNLAARLPGIRVRVFVKDVDGAVREPPMKLDTLFADLDKEHVVLTWRGIVNVRDDDLEDVRTVLIASEELEGPSLPEAHYRRVIEEFEADPLETERRMPGAIKALAAARAAANDDAEHPERTPAERAAAILEHQDGSMAPPGLRPEFEKALEDAKKKFAAAEPMPEVPAAPSPPKPLGELVDKAREAAKSLRALGPQSGVDPDDLDKLEAILDDPMTARAIKMATPPSLDEIGPRRDLAERNLCRMDLSGCDLSGANLAGANLIGAKLVGARLAGANLGQAILSQADLSDADLSGADLSRALLEGARAPKANLTGATLNQTLFISTNLQGAVLVDAKGQMPMWSNANLTEANLKRIDLVKGVFEGATLERADLSDATLVQCSLIRSKAKGLILVGALVNGTSFLETELAKASGRGVRGEGTSWIRSVLDDADFELAVLPAAHFMRARAVGTNFFGADLRRSEFYRARLDRAVLEKANLFRVSFNKAKLNGTRFRDANLYDARFLGASGAGCDFNGANLTRAVLPS